MTFHFLDDVFLLNLTLEATQGVFQRLALLNPNFGQNEYTPKLVRWDPCSYGKVAGTSQGPEPLKCAALRLRRPLVRLEQQPQRELHLARRVGAGGAHEVRRAVVVAREVSVANVLIRYHELPGGIQKTVVADVHAAVGAVQQIEGLGQC